MQGRPRFWAGIRALIDDIYHRAPFASGRVERLGIEGVAFVDGPRGVVLHGGATTFPVTMARGATWDPDLEERIGEAIGREVRSHGANLYGGVCINVLRHPAWGRAQETYGEDPHHLGVMGAALVRGVERHAMACVKHFALNSMEDARFSVDVQVDPRALHEVYLPHFKACIDAGASAVMSAYNAVNGAWCGENEELLDGVLKRRWGFTGFVVTDFLFGIRDAARAAAAGQDLEMPFRLVFHQGLAAAVAEGRVPEARLDDAIRRRLAKTAAVPAGDYPEGIRACPDHVALALEAAEKSIVLLKNDAAALPLAPGETLAVIGALGAVPNLGDRGSSDTRPERVITPLAALRAALPGRVRYAAGDDLEEAASLAAGADAALVVVGYTHREEGERVIPPDATAFAPLIPPPTRHVPRGLWTALARQVMGRGSRFAERMVEHSFGVGGDRLDLGLPQEQIALVKAVAAKNPRCIVVVMAGSAVLMEGFHDHAAAILMLWYPGMEGGTALARVVTGELSPSGKLPFVIPTDAGHLPAFDASAKRATYDLWHGHQKLARDGHAPAFPFGFGLGYSPTQLSSLRLTATAEEVRVEVWVENLGERPVEEVVQVYAGRPGSAVERPARKLVGFRRVPLAPGERRPVAIAVAHGALRYFDVTLDDFRLEPGGHRFFVGRSSLDPRGLEGDVHLPV
ncbi:MAG: glycoside hydrolase family 3 C-terminal domain-containing protein [Myxococcales bacterium]|nr:glycoside hydrolase family 3 C-terminal domain-containing protein [Myxococcales bacterium]